MWATTNKNNIKPVTAIIYFLPSDESKICVISFMRQKPGDQESDSRAARQQESTVTRAEVKNPNSYLGQPIIEVIITYPVRIGS
jgi:hypothetical protein